MAAPESLSSLTQVTETHGMERNPDPKNLTWVSGCPETASAAWQSLSLEGTAQWDINFRMIGPDSEFQL
jgi:hypothetical protein